MLIITSNNISICTKIYFRFRNGFVSNRPLSVFSFSFSEKDECFGRIYEPERFAFCPNQNYKSMIEIRQENAVFNCDYTIFSIYCCRGDRFIGGDPFTLQICHVSCHRWPMSSPIKTDSVFSSFFCCCYYEMDDGRIFKHECAW